MITLERMHVKMRVRQPINGQQGNINEGDVVSWDATDVVVGITTVITGGYATEQTSANSTIARADLMEVYPR